MTLQALEGHVVLTLPTRKVDMTRGSFFALEPPWPHDLEALEDSVVLLTLRWPGTRAFS